MYRLSYQVSRILDCLPEEISIGDREKISEVEEEIKKDQILDFCGNALEAKNTEGEYFLIMSSRAFNAYSENQKTILAKYYKNIIHSELETIEKFGGGSARCMLNELF